MQTINPDGGTNTVVYNAIGQQQATIDPLGRTNSYTYDVQGRLIQTTFPDGSYSSSAYDPNGNRTNSVDQLGRTTTYVYDALNRLVQTVYPDNTSNTTAYDDVGRVQFSIDARSVTNATGYDVAGQRIAVTNAWATPATNSSFYAFDANGNQTNSTDALGHTTTNVFDPLNRQVQVWYADGTKTSTGFDADGRRIAETNQDGLVTRFAYDGAGRLIAVTNALTNATTYAYDQAGNQTNQVDALGRSTLFEYDSMGRRINRILPGGQIETFGYDVAGNLLYHTNFNGTIITNLYDPLNRVLERVYPNGTSNTFTYTLTGQRQTMNDPSGAYSYAYDLRDRLITNTAPAGTLVYAYDANGNVINVTSSTAGGTSVMYQYDALNRLTNVIDARLSGTQNTAYGFDPVGNLQSLRYPNGVTNLYQHDSLNRLTNLVWKLNTANLATFYYQLGSTGNRTTLNESFPGTNRTYTWKYDALYRMTNEAISGTDINGSLGYSLDAVGNRLSRTNSLGSILASQTFTYSSNDWINTDKYDSNGNTITYASNQPYAYNYENQLINFNNGAVVIVYDADGNRVKKVTSAGTTLYLVDSHNPSGYAQVLEELTVSGGMTNLARAYTYGLSLISQRLPGVTTNFYGVDGHGSARFLLSPAGTVTDTYAYDAYGNLIASTGSMSNNHLYCSEQFDVDLSSYYLRARTYNPGTGRFPTMDTEQGEQEDPLSLHKYLYGGDNPVDNVDPTGHDFEMLAVMDIFSSFFAMISPATTRAQATAQRVLGTGRVSSRAFWEVYPDYDTFIADMVWDLVGGSIGATYGKNPDSNQMSCATRLSYALNNVGGNEIPDLGHTSPPRSYKNSSSVTYHGRKGDGKYYIVGAGDMKDYLLQKWGKEDAKIWDVPKLKQFTAGLGMGQIAVFATPGPHGYGHSGVLKQGYEDPYVEGELPVWVWALSIP